VCCLVHTASAAAVLGCLVAAQVVDGGERYWQLISVLPCCGQACALWPVCQKWPGTVQWLMPNYGSLKGLSRVRLGSPTPAVGVRHIVCLPDPEAQVVVDLAVDLAGQL
jgi:hypothetical protein